MRKTWLVIPAAACLAAGITAAAAADAGGTAGTIWACVSPTQHLTNVSVTAPPSCPAGSYPVSWAGTVPGPSPSPSPAATSPSPGPSPAATGTVPAGTLAGYSCTTADPQGACPASGAYDDTADISWSDGSNTYVANQMWGCGDLAPGSPGSPCGVQELGANSPADFAVTSAQPAQNTAVLAYPDVNQGMDPWDGSAQGPLSGFSSITSAYAEAMNATAGTDAEAAYDMWVSNTGTAASEIMIWVDNHGQTPSGSPVATAVIGGRTWTVWADTCADCTISFVDQANEPSGSVPILASSSLNGDGFFDWLVSHGYEPATAHLDQVNFGWEICSTGGVPENFYVTRYTLDAQCANGAAAGSC